jgi:hypothetical protein
LEVANNPRNRFLFQAYTGRRRDAGLRAAGVLTWDFETVAVAEKLMGLGGTPQTREVAKGTAEDQSQAASAAQQSNLPEGRSRIVPLL